MTAILVWHRFERARGKSIIVIMIIIDYYRCLFWRPVIISSDSAARTRRSTQIT